MIVVTQILALILLTACATVGSVLDTPTSTNICHATDDPSNPYEEITVTNAELNEHLAHPNDIFPVPVDGCPASPAADSGGKITICHVTGSETNPYSEITVSVNGLEGHDKHDGDIIPVPEGGCPASLVVSTPQDSSTVCHATGDTAIPYEELTVTSAELSEHLEHPNDFSPVPVSGCPATLAVISEGMIAICHATGDAATPYEEFTVSVDGLDGHGVHEGDVFPSTEGGCPTADPVVSGNDKITICHATGSKKNPYNEITIGVDGLSGHNQHEGDIIPAPAGGCPTTK
ncbi:MAG: hypothetical protein HY865_02120 [Chloroflexi bacterium]|nr:hypothetical protein [Chloroflexota bacterium]